MTIAKLEPLSADAVIFDCDGTLVDSEKLSLAVLIECVAELGLQISFAEAMQRFAGNELSVVFHDLESRLGRSLPDDFLEVFRQRQMELLRTSVEAVPGAKDLLDQTTLPRCVASNAPLDKIHLCLKTTGLQSYFSPSMVFSAYEIQVWKPAPDLFLRAASSMNVAAERCVVIEDSVFGIRAGLAAGMQVIAYDPHERLTGQFAGVHCVRELAEAAVLLFGAASV